MIQINHTNTKKISFLFSTISLFYSRASKSLLLSFVKIISDRVLFICYVMCAPLCQVASICLLVVLLICSNGRLVLIHGDKSDNKETSRRRVCENLINCVKIICKQQKKHFRSAGVREQDDLRRESENFFCEIYFFIYCESLLTNHLLLPPLTCRKWLIGIFLFFFYSCVASGPVIFVLQSP